MARQPHFLGKRMQLAFVVEDIDEAMRYWTQTLGVGPFVFLESCLDDRRLVYRGAPSQVDWSLGFAYWNDVQIELIQQTNDKPSAFKDFLAGGGTGLQHIGFWPDDFAAACTYLESRGHERVSAIYVDDGECNGVYYASPGHIGPMIELVPWTAHRAAYFSRIRRLSDNWDGVTRPVRKFAGRAAFLASGEGAAD